MIRIYYQDLLSPVTIRSFDPSLSAQLVDSDPIQTIANQTTTPLIMAIIQIT